MGTHGHGVLYPCDPLSEVDEIRIDKNDRVNTSLVLTENFPNVVLLHYWKSRRCFTCHQGCFNSSHRSNNTCESHNRMLSNFIGVPHPNIYNFIAALSLMEENAYADAVALEAGERPKRGRKVSAIVLDRNLRNLYRGIRRPPGNRNDAILRFLEAAVHTFDNAYDRAVDEV